MAKLLIEAFGHMLRQDDDQPFRNVMPWFAQGVASMRQTVFSACTTI